ncbi:MAG: AIDA repeat-containing protein, partial [Lentisphaeria bacterium]|nr:AIDA repeat-containing protein [Lentisphaeria bacterium]
MAEYYVSQTVSGTVLTSGDVMYVSSGGTGESIVVSSGGRIVVSSGGTALDLQWTPCVGTVEALEGAVVTYAAPLSGVWLGSGDIVYSSAAAVVTGEDVKGSMYVYSGGAVDKTTVNGYMYVSSGGTADSTTVNWGGNLYVSSGGTANGTTVNSRGYLTVSSGGTANSTTVSGGNLTVSSGGTANSTTVNDFGYMYVSLGGTANSTVNDGDMYVFLGGTANSTTVNSAGSMMVSSGGTANSTTVNSGGRMYVYGGTANSTTVNYGGRIVVSSGGTANSTTVSGVMTVSSGGTANSITVSGGYMYISSGGTALDIVWTPCVGYVWADGGATVTYVSSYSGVYFGPGETLLSSAMTMAGKTVTGFMYVMTSGTANSTTVNLNGNLYVWSGGTANSTTVNWAGRMYVSSGGTANSTTVNSSGYLYVSSGGTADSTTVNSGGRMYVSSGGTADSTTVSGGYMYVENSGTANSITVNGYYGSRSSDGGYLYVSSGGTVIGAAVTSGGSLHVFSGGTALNVAWTPFVGVMEAENGAIVTYVSSYSGVYFGSGESQFSSAMTMAGKTVTGSMYVMTSGAVTYTTVDNGGSMVVANATADSTTVNYGGYLYISNGGTANSTTVNGASHTSHGEIVGALYVSSGGTANSTTVNRFGRMFVSSGGTADSTTVNDGGNLYVSSGGTADSTTVNSGGDMTVYDGGTANSTTVNSSSYMYVSSGGTATAIMENGGYVAVAEGANVTFASNTFSGLMLSKAATLHSGTTAVSTTVKGYGYLYVSSGGTANSTVNNGYMYVSLGGTANSTTVNTLGHLYVSSGGTANSTTVNGSGDMTVYDGGTANSTTVIWSGYLTVSSGGTANSTTVNSWGYLTVCSGGTANSTTVNYGGCMFVSSGGTASIVFDPWRGQVVSSEGADVTYLEHDANIYYGGKGGLISKYDSTTGLAITSGNSTIIFSGGTANSTTVNSSGYLYVSSGGTADSTTVNDGGNLYVSSGGTANSTTVNSWGYLTVCSGGTANNTTVNQSGYLMVSGGGTATNIVAVSGANLVFGIASDTLIQGTIDGSAFELRDTVSGGIIDRSYDLHVSSGGTANFTTVNRYGSMFVSSGGTANSTTVNGSGYLTVSSGGTANSTTVNPDGKMTVYDGGTATSTTVNYYGYLTVSSGGTANGTTVNSGGRLYVGSSGTATSTTVNYYGSMFVFSGGTADSTTVNSGGRMFVSRGGKVTGPLTIESGGGVTVSSGGIIDFDISALASQNTALVNDLSLIKGTPTYTITVSGGQATGTYTLAEGAADFSAAISVRTSTENLGTVVVNGAPLSHNDCTYTLVRTDSTLTLRVAGDEIPPDAPRASADITAPTGKNVTVTAVFSEDSAQRQYSLDNSDWLAYTAPVVMTENGSVYFRGIDAAGNISKVTEYVVSNIDKTVPEITVTADVTSPTRGNVTVTALFSDDAVEKLYGFDNETWTAYTSPVVMTENGIVYFKGVNAIEGAAVTSYTVSNIYKTAPVLTVTGNPESWTNRDVTLTAASGEEAEIEYSFDNAAWTAGSEVTVTENGTVYFRATDPAGNVTAETVVVDKIDKIPPETPAASADSVLPTNKDVTVTAEFGGDAAQREYSLDGNNWSAYTSGVVMTENGTVYFRGIDAAGNVSQVTEYVVSNIDKTLPDAPEVSADFTSPTRGNVTVTAVFGGDVAEKLYGFDGETWLAYTSPVVVTENGTVYFKSVGPTGKSAVTPYQVANIDRTAPTLTVTGNPADWTNKDVTLTAACDENAEIEYSFDNETWTAGSEVTVGENATVYFRATDAAGNVSAETVVVDKIDKIPPEAPETSVDVTTPTSGTVTVRAAFGADAARKEYSPDGTTWLDYAGGVTLSSNGTVYFRAVDAAGNISDLSSR